MSEQITNIKKRDLKSILENQYAFIFNNSNLALCPLPKDTIPSFSVKKNNGIWLFRESKKNFLVFLTRKEMGSRNERKSSL